MGTLPEATTRGPEYRLYDSGAVGTAAFICCPLGGAILIAVNYRRLGKAGKCVFAVIVGLIATALNILIRWNWNTSPGTLGRLEYDAIEILVLTCMWFCTWRAAEADQGAAVEEHIGLGGQLDSRYTAAWIGIATLAAVVAVTGTVVYAYHYRKTVVIGTKDQVIYSGLATKAAAMALGNALKSNEYFQDRGSSVLLDKEIGSTTISFAVQDEVWNRPGMLSSFEELARELAPKVGGLPIQVRLVDSNLNVKQTSTVGEVSFDGGDGVYYEGLATKAQAQTLGQWLASKGFFRGRGTNVILSTHDNGTTFTFVVADGVWNNPGKVRNFEDIVRDVAPMLGGLPIEMHLVNTHLQVEKDELIQQGQ